MTETWRLIDTCADNAVTQMSTDEAIAIARGEGKAPNTVRLYRWRPSAVSVGYFQSLRHEVDLEACKRIGVDVIRRITGGGAVFHDQDGELTYSLIASEADPKIPSDILESYRLVCGCIVSGLSNLGVESEFKPVNDVTASGRKISGNAQTRRNGVVLQHGTILVDVDVARVFSVLKVSDAKISDKAIKMAEERVTSVRKSTGREVSFEDAEEALVDGFQRGLDVRFVPGKLTPYENELVSQLRRKYGSEEWIYQR